MKNEFDNRLTDKGWRSMRKALDREMPEERRRRPLVWWWMGALLLLAVGGAGGWQLYRTFQPAPPPASPVQKVVPAGPVVEARSEKRQQELLPTTIAKGNEQQQTTITGALYSAAGTAAVAPAAGVQKSASIKNPEPTAPSTMLIFNEIKTNEMLPGAAPGVPGEEALLLLPERLSSVHSEKKTEPKISPVGMNGAIKPQKHRSPSRWSIGISAGVNTERFSSLNGFSAGLVADWKPFRKWGLRMGAQYARYQPSVKTRPVVSLGNSAYAEATGNFDVLQDAIVFTDTTSATPSANQAEPSVLVPVDRLQRVEMPLAAFWQPAKFLRLYSGIMISCNLSAKASQQNYANNKVYMANDQEALNNLNELTASTLPRWHVDLTFGAGFRIGKRIELNAFYQPCLGQSGKDTAYSNGTSNGSYQLAGQTLSSNPTSRFFFNGILFF